MNEIDDIDKKAKVKFNDIELIRSLTFPVAYKVLSKKTDTLDKVNNDRQIYEENKVFYSELIKVLKYAEKHIDETMKKLN